MRVNAGDSPRSREQVPINKLDRSSRCLPTIPIVLDWNLTVSTIHNRRAVVTYTRQILRALLDPISFQSGWSTATSA